MESEDEVLTVLSGTLIEKRDGHFFYRIEGDKKWLNIFRLQKERYVQNDAHGQLVYSVPLSWYVGRKCDICVGSYNNYGGKLFFDIDRHLDNVEIYKVLRKNYWNELSVISGDVNWLERLNS